MTCQIDGCLDCRPYSLAMLEEHINKHHLDLMQLPCPALGKFDLLSILFLIIYNLQVAFIWQLVL
jgi:hypothetical protein